MLRLLTTGVSGGMPRRVSCSSQDQKLWHRIFSAVLTSALASLLCAGQLLNLFGFTSDTFVFSCCFTNLSSSEIALLFLVGGQALGKFENLIAEFRLVLNAFFVEVGIEEALDLVGYDLV